MIIPLRCKNCKDILTGDTGDYLFFCRECSISYLLNGDRLSPVNTFEIDSVEGYTHLLPLYLYDITVDYTVFASKRQGEVAQLIGRELKMVVRGFTMIDPVYFGDLELATADSINQNKLQLRPYTIRDKNFRLNVRPDVAERLLRYNFMRYFDRRADITGLKYNLTTNAMGILFLKATLKEKTIYLSDLQKELPSYAILSI